MRRRNCENGKFDIHEREKEKIGVKPARNRLKFGQKPAKNRLNTGLKPAKNRLNVEVKFAAESGSWNLSKIGFALPLGFSLTS